MKLVRLVVTGELERAGLAHALARVFPDTEFETLSGGVGKGFTSGRVIPVERGPVPSNAEKLAQHVVAEVVATGSRLRRRADLVVAVEDLELGNADRAPVVVEALRSGVRHHVERVNSDPAERARVLKAVRERASFHIAAPMIESWLFGEPAALDRAGRAANRTSLFHRGACDPERFVVEDAAYVAVPACPKPSWAHSPLLRPRHPKKYVAFLADARGDGTSVYKETTTGAAALSALDWAAVLSVPGQFPFLRALLCDLEDALGTTATVCVAPPTCATWPPPRERVLRNC